MSNVVDVEDEGNIDPANTKYGSKRRRNTTGFAVVTADNVELSPGFQIYTDGSCTGNRNVRERASPAGWGICVVRGSIIHTELYGPVVLDPYSPYSLHAEVGSNNTAELSAVGEALIWIRDRTDVSSLRNSEVCICYDSEYAHKSVVGIFNGPKNRSLYMTIRNILSEVLLLLRNCGGRLRWKHVKGHSGNHFNDRADYLAGLGAGGQTQRERDEPSARRLNM
eukprot:GSChrysophyteH1.ASY1.ANO1.3148.1 assembled CDS